MLENIYGRKHHGHENPWDGAPAWAIELGCIGLAAILEIELLKEAMMSELTDLNTNITKLSTDVDTLIARPAADPTAVPATDVAAAAAAVKAIDDKIVAVLPPTP